MSTLRDDVAFSVESDPGRVDLRTETLDGYLEDGTGCFGCSVPDNPAAS